MTDSRRKGKVFERTVANLLRKWDGVTDSRRGLTQSRGAIEADVVIPDLRLWLECKHRRRVNVTAALKQAERDRAETGSDALASMVIGRDTGGDIFFAVSPQGLATWRTFFLIPAPSVRVSSERRWRLDLAPVKTGDALVVTDASTPYVVGWIDTLETLWASRAK